MSNEFIARKGLIVQSLTTGTTETEILVVDSDGLVKTRTNIALGGSSGSAGSSGISGSSGTSGTRGSSGSSGTSGANGSSGTSGTSGVSGTSGTSGSSGTSGAAGSSGTSGTSGSSGTSGTRGSSGSSGTSGTAGSSGTGFNTITNPADNRVLTSLGTTNTANAEANLTFNGNLMVLNGAFSASSISDTYNLITSPAIANSPGAFGEIMTRGNGTLTAGNLYTFSAGTWVAADADSTTTSTGLLGIALGTTPSAGILLRGYARSTSYSWADNKVLYISSTAGSMTDTAPTGVGKIVRVVGYMVYDAGNIIYFNPSNDWIEL